MDTIFVWTFGDVLSLAIAAFVAFIFACASGLKWLEQRVCKHDGGIGETQACDAICHKCGKNLGFIGTWRDKNSPTGPAK